jgi:hypothetical protein
MSDHAIKTFYGLVERSLCFGPISRNRRAIMRIAVSSSVKHSRRYSNILKEKDKEDLPKLYMMAARALNMAPDQHTEEPIKAILVLRNFKRHA